MSVKKGIFEHGQDAMAATIAELKQLLVNKKAMHAVDRKTLSASQIKKLIRSQLLDMMLWEDSSRLKED